MEDLSCIGGIIIQVITILLAYRQNDKMYTAQTMNQTKECKIVISKGFEWIVSNQFNSYLCDNNVIYRY